MKQQARMKKHRYQNGAVRKSSFIFSPFLAREAQAFLSVPSRLFSPPSACHGLSLGKTAQRELIVGLGYCIRDSRSKQAEHIGINIEATAGSVKGIMSLLSPHLTEPLRELHLLQPLPPPLLLLPLLLSFQHVGN